MYATFPGSSEAELRTVNALVVRSIRTLGAMVVYMVITNVEGDHALSYHAELDGPTIINMYDEYGVQGVHDYVRDKGLDSLLSNCKIEFLINDPDLKIDRTELHV